MENGIFLLLTEALLQIPGMLAIVFLVGFIGFFIVFLLMPIRLLWVIFRHLKPGGNIVSNRGSYITSNIFLALAVYGVIEFVVVMANAGSGSVSGLMIPMFSFIPFILYIYFEWFRRKAYKEIKDDESNQSLQTDAPKARR